MMLSGYDKQILKDLTRHAGEEAIEAVIRVAETAPIHLRDVVLGETLLMLSMFFQEFLKEEARLHE